MTYTIVGEDCKLHNTSTEQVAQNVCKELKDRYPYLELDITKNDWTDLMIDFGGAALIGDKPYTFAGSEVSISFWAHQYLTLLNSLNNGIDAPRAGDFVKIHGAWAATCIDTQLAIELRDFIKANEHSIAAKEEESIQKFEKAMSSLRDAGYVASRNEVAKADIN